MTQTLRDKALLPAGLRDILPPNAAHEAGVAETLIGVFERHGYDRVKPPLIEFEDSLLSGSGGALAERSFRLMDPASHRMLALRPDMTLQIARIAASRLARAARPLRLAYAGEILRVRGSQLRPERQFGQVGAELIGSASPAADTEMILMAVAGLRAVGVEGLSVDLGLPTLIPALCRHWGVAEADARTLRAALDRKDAGAVAAVAPRIGDDRAALLADLLNTAGPAGRALERLAGLDLPAAAAAERSRLAEVAERVRAGAPDLTVTLDPVENRGFEYHAGVTFAFFARHGRGELGRGGRYLADRGDGHPGEPATGLTLYMNAVLRVLPEPDPRTRIFLPAGTPAPTADQMRDAGWATVAGLDPVDDPAAEARRLACTHVLRDGAARAVVAVDDEGD